MNQDYLYKYKATIIDVYDGDTVTAIVDLGFKVRFEMKLRLYGINAPELRGAERPEGIKSRDWLREKILNKEVLILTHKDKTGKYGRYLATIFLDNTDINALMVAESKAQFKDY